MLFLGSSATVSNIRQVLALIERICMAAVTLKFT